jgi:hypothetical protein
MTDTLQSSASCPSWRPPQPPSRAPASRSAFTPARAGQPQYGWTHCQAPGRCWPLTLHDSQWTSSACLRLGLHAGPANAPPNLVRLRFTILPDDPDHSLTCPCLTQQHTWRHDSVTTNWHCVSAQAGVHTTEDPPVRFFAVSFAKPQNTLATS